MNHFKMLKPICMSKDELPEEALKLTPRENAKIERNLVRSWHLGPAKASEDRNANTPFWASLAIALQVKLLEARRRTCSNCEYGHNSPKHLEAMEHIPDTEGDLDGGGRVWCDKFNFICHSLRSCQSHEIDEH